MFICEVILITILICKKLVSVGLVQQKIKFPSPHSFTYNQSNIYFLRLIIFFLPCKIWPTNLTHYFSVSRACSISLLRAIITRNHLPFFKTFSNFVHFCPNLQTFCPFLTSLTIFCPVFALF